MFIEPENSTALVNAIVALVEHPEDRRSYGSNAREYILRHGSREATAKSYIEVLTAVLAPTQSADNNG